LNQPPSQNIVTAAVLIIGNEILSGRTQDTNLRHLAITLGGWGIRVLEARVIPDVEATIIQVVNELRARYDYVFTTGGIGPTHDDITAASIAKAFGVELCERPEIAALIRRREAPPEVMAARLRMALVPMGSDLIENATGGPQSFSIGNVYVMAGIPVVMQAMLSTLESKLKHGTVLQSRSVTAFLAESAIAVPLGNLQLEYPQVDIGSYPFTQDGRYATTLVMRSTDEQVLATVVEKVEQLVAAAGGKPS
jgi:molybdenum cofactor synthesis domain-containing protein